MLRNFAMFLAIALALAGVDLPDSVLANEPATAPMLAVDQNFVPVQYGPGSGPGYGDGRGPRRGAVRCRLVRGEPGSGTGPQRVCEPVRCRTVVVPGSGLGPQRVCD